MKFLVLFLLFTLPLAAGEHENLLKLAEKWGVPQPHPKSTLVKIWAHGGTKDFYLLGFVEPGKPKQALVGFEYRRINQRTSKPPIHIKSISRLPLRDITCAALFGSPNNTNSGILTAIQLMRHGYPKLGKRLLEKSLETGAGHPHSPLYIAKGLTPEDTLAKSCLAAASNEITTPHPDFRKIKRRIETVLKDKPKFKNKSTDWILTALKATVNHPRAKPGSIEALIDAYLTSGGVSGAMTWDRKKNPAKEALILKGFDAIPTLIQHLDDKRITNHLMQGFNNFSSFPMSAGNVINNYLQSFANDEFGSNWLERQKGITSKEALIKAWWKKASAMGEKKYVQKYTVTSQKKGMASISSELLLIASHRYPELLPAFYTTILKTNSQSHSIAEALANNTRLALETRKKYLIKGINTGKSEHRNYALWNLIEIDVKTGEQYLLRLIKKAPKTATGKFWLDQNAGLANIVAKSNNPAIWQALHDYLSRADLGMRMELISRLRPAKDAKKSTLLSFFKIYDRFATDTTVLNEKSDKRFDGPGAGFPYKKIEVRNFIHKHYAGWLELELKAPDPEKLSFWKWNAYRKAVAATVKEYRKKHSIQ